MLNTCCFLHGQELGITGQEEFQEAGGEELAMSHRTVETRLSRHGSPWRIWTFHFRLNFTSLTSLYVGHLSVMSVQLRNFICSSLIMLHDVARCCTMLHVLQLGSIAIGLTDSLWHTLPPLPFASGSIEVVIPCLNSQDHWVRRPKTASAAISGDLISTF